MFENHAKGDRNDRTADSMAVVKRNCPADCFQARCPDLSWRGLWPANDRCAVIGLLNATLGFFSLKIVTSLSASSPWDCFSW